MNNKALGAAITIGVAMGVALDSFAIGIPVGIAMYFAFDQAFKKNKDSEDQNKD